ncbi:putative transcriptional regulator [Thermoplasmatales archaeon BRNA1]|nr:putative transcriptional regulator [Thermoplasmatales archaeon BRNA1]
MISSADYDYALDATMSAIEGRWKTVILCRLANAGVPMRFNQLMAELPGISPRIFSLQLKELEKDGLLVREVRSESPKCVVYSLSDRGLSLIPILDLLAVWGMQNFSTDLISIGTEQIREKEKARA